MLYFVYDPNWDPEKAPQTPPGPKFFAEMGAYIADERASGRLVATGSLQPRGVRLTLAEGKFQVTDGPFVEVKELTGGWALINCTSLEEAVESCKRFRLIVGDGVAEIVPVMGSF